MYTAIGVIIAILFYIMIGRRLAERRLFWPDGNHCAPAQAEAPEFREIAVQTSDGQTRNVWYARGGVNSGRPAILYLHGNAFGIPTCAFIMRPYIRAGFPVCMAAYRGFDKDSKGGFCEKGFIADARAAYDFLKSEGHRDIALHGVSMGCSVALGLAVSVRPFAVVLESPFYDLKSMAPKLPLLSVILKHRFSNGGYAEKLESPVLLMHGAEDRLVNVWHAGKLFGEIKSPDKRLHIIGRGTHNLFAFGSVEYAIGWLSERI